VITENSDLAKAISGVWLWLENWGAWCEDKNFGPTVEPKLQTNSK